MITDRTYGSIFSIRESRMFGNLVMPLALSISSSIFNGAVRSNS